MGLSTLPIRQMLNLDGLCAVVTGAGMGIGERISLRFAEAGASVILADRNEGAAVEAAAKVTSRGGVARARRCDVSAMAEVNALVDFAIDTYGRIDVVINNAGVFPVAKAIDLTEATWNRVMDTNLKGAFFLSQAAAKHMSKAVHGGSIVNIASIDSFHPSGHLAHYDVTKAGIVMMTKSLALEWASAGIRVNAIAPGAIETPGSSIALETMGGLGTPARSGSEVKRDFVERIPMGRMGEPDEIACAAVFLASRGASYVTGATLVVDGGFLQS